MKKNILFIFLIIGIFSNLSFAEREVRVRSVAEIQAQKAKVNTSKTSQHDIKKEEVKLASLEKELFYGKKETKKPNETVKITPKQKKIKTTTLQKKKEKIPQKKLGAEKKEPESFFGGLIKKVFHKQ